MSDNDIGVGSAVIDAIDARQSREQVARALEKRLQALAALPEDVPAAEKARLLLDIAEGELELTQNESAWDHAREAFDLALADEAWQLAAEAADLLYRTEQPASIIALANGIWLAVAFPVDPEVSYTLLSHFVDETPPDSDGAAVAAMLAHYLAELRAPEDQYENITFLTNNLVGQVAQRHGKVKSQPELELWIERLQLGDEQLLLKRMDKILDVISEGQWWYDRDELRAKLPQ